MRSDIITIVLSFLVLVGCGSRKAETSKQELKTEIQEQQNEAVKIDSSASIKIDKNVKISEKSEDFEFIVTKEYYESGVLKSERKEKRKGTKMEEKRYQEEKTQTTEKLKKTEIKTLKKQEKVSRVKQKSTEREESKKWLWVCGFGFLAFVVHFWVKQEEK